MNRRVIATLLFAGVSASPTLLRAQDPDHHDQDHHAKVYYDRVHKDKHEWNDGEAASWDRYRRDHHVTVTEFDRASKRQQQAYWNYRHDHPDAH
jgi:hypothetical protein